MTLRMIGLLPVEALNQAPFDGQLRGQTPLHLVSGGRDYENGRHRVIEALVAGNADMELRDLNGRTPLLVAAGAAYCKGAYTLHERGANMTATKSNGRNFADEANGANKKLVSWWSDLCGLQPSSAPSEPRSCIFMRGGVPDKRHAHQVLHKTQRSRMQSGSEVRRIHDVFGRKFTRGINALGGTERKREWGEAVEAAERGSHHGPNVDASWTERWLASDDHPVGAWSNHEIWLRVVDPYPWTECWLASDDPPVARPDPLPGDLDRYRDRRRPDSGYNVSRRDRDRGYGGRRCNYGMAGDRCYCGL